MVLFNARGSKNNNINSEHEETNQTMATMSMIKINQLIKYSDSPVHRDEVIMPEKLENIPMIIILEIIFY